MNMVTWRRLPLVLILAALVLVGLARPGGATTLAAPLSVPCDAAQLIGAIGNAANAALSLAAGCTYTLTTVNNDTDGPNGLPNITRALTIDGNGAIIERNGASDTPAFRLIHVASGGSLALRSLTLRGGLTPNGHAGSPGTSAQPGGGIYAAGPLTLTGVTVSGNATGGGGTSTAGAFFETGLGGSGGAGGGVYAAGTLTLSGSTISGNRTGNGGSGTHQGGSGGAGGAIYAAGPLTMVTSSIGGNIVGTGGFGDIGGSGALGGGIYAGDTVTVTASTINNNHAGSASDGRYNGAPGGGGGVSTRLVP